MKRTKQILVLLFLVASGLWAWPLHAQEEPPSADDSPQEVGSKSLLDVYTEGGVMMHVLFACSVGTIAVVVYCFVRINSARMMPKGLQDAFTRLMQKREVNEAYDLCQKNPNAFTNVVKASIVKVNFERDLANKASMEQAAGETLDEEETRLMVWVNYLNVFATIAPMIGLLGTVWGMIESFDQLNAGNTRPQDLAGGIGTAMSTTAGGLVVGIPAMFFYFFFRNRVMGIMATIQRNATFLIDVLSGDVQLSDSD
ncbi:MAG: MotA/TolQ/ExbB proton channel family protein [Verrucomicrobiota bacterium]